MKRFAAAILAGTAVLACSPPVVVTADPAPAPVVATTVTMTPVQRSQNGMVVAHAGISGWSAGPAALPSGAQMVVLEGDPTKSELFTVRLRFPNNYVVPPHFHSTWEHITVISGVLHLGMGDTFSMTNATELRAGSFAALPSGMRHFVHAAGETVLQLHGMGPWTVTYVNRTDDPRNR